MQNFEELYSWKDEFVKITLYNDTGGFTNLSINNGLQFAEKDEHRYHQSVFMLPSLFSPVKKQKVLILGGGDGLGTRELLKLDHIESIDLVDISEAMIFMSKKHHDMIALNYNSLNNEKVTVHIEDSLNFIQEAIKKGRKWDLIILDYPDPSVEENNPINVLFSKEHYADVIKLLSEDGVLSVQSTSVYISPNVFAKISLNMEASSSAMLRLVINIQSFGDIGVIFARKRSEYDNKEWKLHHEIPKKAFFNVSSIERFLHFFEDEKPSLAIEHIKEANIATLIKYDISADIRRNKNNFFINNSINSYKRFIDVSEEESIKVYEENKNRNYKTVKEIFVQNKYLLGYPNNDFESMQEKDSFFQSFNIYKDKNGNIDGIIKFREDDNFTENEYIYYKNLKNIKPMFRAYAEHIKENGFKPILITFWEHNVLTENIVNKLGAETVEKGFTWNIALENVDISKKPQENIYFDLGENGKFVFNGILGCWETDWIESKQIFNEMVRLCIKNNIPNLSIFSKTPPVEFDYFIYKVVKLDYYKNKRYKRLMDYFYK